MESAPTNKAGSGHRDSPHELAQLIRKLRWIGLDDEARRLELAVSTLPPGRAGQCVGRAVQHRLSPS